MPNHHTPTPAQRLRDAIEPDLAADVDVSKLTPFAARRVRLAGWLLPSSPWTTVRVVLDDGYVVVWHTRSDARLWFDTEGLTLDAEDLACVTSYTVLATPPMRREGVR